MASTRKSAPDEPDPRDEGGLVELEIEVERERTEEERERDPVVIGPQADPTIRAARYERRRPDDGDAFLPDAVSKHTSLSTPDAEADAEEFIVSATTGESVAEDARDEFVADELGGPFVELDQEARLPNEENERRHPVMAEARRARRTLVR